MAMHRTQIMLEQDQYQQLKREAERTGRSIGALVREAVTERYGVSTDEFSSALDASFGAWEERDFDGYEWVEQGRGGMDRPIGESAWE